MQHVLDLVFPHRCVACEALVGRRGFCDGCAQELTTSGEGCDRCGVPREAAGTCGACVVEPPPYRRASWAFEFGGGVQRALHRLKFGGHDGVAADLIAALPSLPPADVNAVIPVPLHWSRRLLRGYNQAALLASALATRLGLPVDYEVLRRVHRGRVQSRLAEVERAVNVAGLYAAARPVSGRILLVDDVMTTAATAAECSRILHGAGAESVDVWTLARVL